ncbi:MAG: SH3 domain-containing protein [Gammaproteobacteria bacterium]|nr:SH3 domain-containing protein [Gammaproteobacteria bacterium]MBD3822843.1 SH3 domain-containing protein [Thiotrichales bacterium]
MSMELGSFQIGTPLNILEEQTIDSLTWYKIRVSAGTDKGKIGWVTKENIKVK